MFDLLSSPSRDIKARHVLCDTVLGTEEAWGGGLCLAKLSHSCAEDAAIVSLWP